MTELEPTRTSSDLTATERVRELLDERGVEYTANERDTQWWPKDNPAGVLAENSRYPHGTLDVYGLTPEQAIAATLGKGTLTAKQVMAIVGRHQPDYCSDTHACFDWQAIADELNATLGSCNCTNDCTNGERTDAPSLPYWWTHDGTLHVELPKLPESISVLLPDQRDREVGSARVWQYTRDSGTCHECAGMDDVFECSACGGRYEGWALKRWARYCPDCGRRIEVDDG